MVTPAKRPETGERVESDAAEQVYSQNTIGEGIPTGERLSSEDSNKILKAQQGRANLMAIGLFCLCILFFMITIVKIGLWG